jgi:hypothetical protein
MKVRNIKGKLRRNMRAKAVPRMLCEETKWDYKTKVDKVYKRINKEDFGYLSAPNLTVGRDPYSKYLEQLHLQIDRLY